MRDSIDRFWIGVFKNIDVHVGYMCTFSSDLRFEIPLKIPFRLDITYKGIIKVLRNLG